MPSSPKCPTPPSPPPVTGSPPGWWCAGSETPATPTPCSRSGATTPSFTNSTLPTVEADITHRRHAIIETTFADLIDGPLAHLPSGRFAANSAWTLCAAISHNLLRAAGTMAGPVQAVARAATLRRTLITVPARIVRPQRQPVLHLPAHRPWASVWLAMWDRILGHGLPPPVPA